VLYIPKISFFNPLIFYAPIPKSGFMRKIWALFSIFAFIFAVSAHADHSGEEGPISGVKTLEVEQLNITCMSSEAEDGISSKTVEANSISFEGVLRTSNPCMELNNTLEKQGENNYVLDLYGSTPQSKQPCIQCVGAIRYSVSFESDKPSKLSVLHDGSSRAEIQTEKSRGNSFLASVLSFFRGLF